MKTFKEETLYFDLIFSASRRSLFAIQNTDDETRTSIDETDVRTFRFARRTARGLQQNNDNW